MDERIRQVGEHEIAQHLGEAERLRHVADTLVSSAEYHLRQAQNWQQYLGDLASSEWAASDRPHLQLILGGE